MFYLGKINSLCALKKTVYGMFLGEVGYDDEVLLPNKYVPEDLAVGESIDVFLYTDSEDRIVATTLKPKILLHQIAVLEVKDVTNSGVFLDWGLDKDLFLLSSEKDGYVQKGDKITVCLCFDEKTDRLFATSKIKKFSDKRIALKEGEEVDLVVDRETEIGCQVIINNLYIGLVFFSKIFQPLHKGDQMKGFIETIREDGKIDVSLQKHGYGHVVDSQDIVLKKLKEKGGTLHLTDKSDPKEITKELLISKKVFKKCLGALYKQRKIKIEENCITLCTSQKP
jgi:uncharacterized protein